MKGGGIQRWWLVAVLLLSDVLSAGCGEATPGQAPTTVQALQRLSAGARRTWSLDKEGDAEAVATAISAAKVASTQARYGQGKGDASLGIPTPDGSGQWLPVDDCVPACVATCAPKCVKQEGKPDMCAEDCNTFCERDCREKREAAGQPAGSQNPKDETPTKKKEAEKEEEEEEQNVEANGKKGDKGDVESSGNEEGEGGESQGGPDKPATPKGDNEEEEESRGEKIDTDDLKSKGFSIEGAAEALFPWQSHSLDSLEAGPDGCEDHCEFECVRECQSGYDKPHKCKDECKDTCSRYCAPVTGKKISAAATDRKQSVAAGKARASSKFSETNSQSKKDANRVSSSSRLLGSNPVYEWLLGSTLIVVVCGLIFFAVRKRLGKDTYVYSSVATLPLSASV